MSDIALTVNGLTYGGWKSMRMSRGIEQIAGSFDLGVSELWPGQRETRQIAPLDECSVSVNGVTVVTGRVDDVAIRHAADAHEVTIAGRDATGSLVDAAVIHKTGEWTNVKMEGIARDILKPFSIPLSVHVDTGRALQIWALEESESAFECLARLAREKAVLLVSDGNGGLTITRAGKGGRAGGGGLELGKNILEGALELSFRERFSEYIVKGSGAKGDTSYGRAARLKATVRDAMVSHHRPLVILDEGVVEIEGLKRRALWEANVRAGQSIDVAMVVQGWGYPGGLWQPNTVVHVRDKWLRIDADLLVKHVLFTLDDHGSRTELRLTLPQAFDLIPLPKEKADPWAIVNRQQQRDIERLKRLHQP